MWLTAYKYTLYFSGLVSLTYGVWLIYRPAGWIAGGVLAVLISMLIDRGQEKP